MIERVILGGHAMLPRVAEWELHPLKTNTFAGRTASPFLVLPVSRPYGLSGRVDPGGRPPRSSIDPDLCVQRMGLLIP